MRFRGLLTALVAAAALVCGISAAADVGSGTGPPTAIGTGGAAASVEKLATEAAVGILRRGGTPWMRLSRLQQSSESPSRSCGIGGGLHGHPHRRRPGHDDRRTRDGADGDAPDVAVGERRSLPSTTRATAVSSVGVPGTVETWADALENYGTMSLAEVFAPAIHVARHGYVIDQVVRPGEREPRLVRRHPGEQVARSGRNSSRRRDRVHEPRARKDVRAHRASRREGFYRGAVADALVETGTRSSARRRTMPGVLA